VSDDKRVGTPASNLLVEFRAKPILMSPVTDDPSWPMIWQHPEISPVAPEQAR
jgi:hypothetical protein